MVFARSRLSRALRHGKPRRGRGLLAGIGFTMALFIANLAFSPDLIGEAKLGISVASLVSAAAGLPLLSVSSGMLADQELTLSACPGISAAVVARDAAVGFKGLRDDCMCVSLSGEGPPSSVMIASTSSWS